MRTVLLAMLLLCGPALGFERGSHPMGETIAERGSKLYRFEHFELDSRDGQRHYRIFLGVPRQAPPKEGYPGAWLLDGNAALALLNEAWLKELYQGHPPLLVMLGYATRERFELGSRSFDYTPAPVGQEGRLPGAFGATNGGGSSLFRELLDERIRPQVVARYPLNEHRQLLWGHSLGGLLVLDTLFTSGGFSDYVAASPALWWHHNLILQSAEHYLAQTRHPPARVLLLRGGNERPDAHPDTDKLSPQQRKMLAARLAEFKAVPKEAAPQLIGRLNALPEVSADFYEFPGRRHGDLVPLSLHHALRRAAGLPDDFDDHH